MWRFIVCQPDGDGGESLITSELPLSSARVVCNLSAPSSMALSIPIHLQHLTGSDGNPVFVPYGSTIYAERNGVIVSGGIVTDIDATGGVLNLQVTGHVGYLQDMPFMGEYGAYNSDPFDLVRYIWAHVQKQPGGNIGLSVDPAKSPRRVGTKGKAAFRGRPAIKDDKGVIVTPAIPPTAEVKDDPFLLSWYQTSNLLDVFNKLSRAVPFDYAERHFWNGDHIAHNLDLAYPTMGKQRADMRFVVGENLIIAPKMYQHGSSYASEIMFLGAGEGKAMVRGLASQPTRSRLRRVRVMSDPGIPSPDLAKSMAQNELKYRTGLPNVTDMEVIDHPNAPIGMFDVGDMIYVQGSNAWFGSADQWVRIASIEYDPLQNESAKIVVVKESE